jgi:hypothetical protein
MHALSCKIVHVARRNALFLVRLSNRAFVALFLVLYYQDVLERGQTMPKYLA